MLVVVVLFSYAYGHFVNKLVECVENACVTILVIVEAGHAIGPARSLANSSRDRFTRHCSTVARCSAYSVLVGLASSLNVCRDAVGRLCPSNLSTILWHHLGTGRSAVWFAYSGVVAA